MKRIDLKEVIHEKAPTLKIPQALLTVLGRIIHLRELNRGLASVEGTEGLDFVDAALRFFNLSYSLQGIPVQDIERPVFVSNHPLGALDGLALIGAVGRSYGTVLCPANDFLGYIPHLKSLLIPVNKHGSKKRTRAPLMEAFESDTPIVTFPAGLCSRMRGGRVRDLKWQKSFVTLSKRYKRTIVPVFTSGRNSWRFYAAAKIREGLGLRFNAEMILLVDEMFRQRNKHLYSVVGRPIAASALSQDIGDWEWARRIRKLVYRLEREGAQDVCL